MDLERFSGLRFVNFSTGHLSVLIYFLLHGEHFLPVFLGCGGTCAHLALGMGISAHSIGDKLRLKSMKSNILGEMSMFMRKGKANKKKKSVLPDLLLCIICKLWVLWIPQTRLGDVLKLSLEIQEEVKVWLFQRSGKEGVGYGVRLDSLKWESGDKVIANFCN